MKLKKERPVLIIAFTLTLVVEFTLMVLVFQKIGAENMPSQIGRILFQLLFIAIILMHKSNTALFILAGYHVVIGLYMLNMISNPHSLELGFGIYHITIGLIIYFHDIIENKLS